MGEVLPNKAHRNLRYLVRPDATAFNDPSAVELKAAGSIKAEVRPEERIDV
jgi:hypothetical protein